MKKAFIQIPISIFEYNITYITAYRSIQELKENHCIILIPSRTDTKYFQKMMESNLDMGIYFFKGRLHFNESKDSAPFPSCIIKLEMPKGKKYILKDYK